MLQWRQILTIIVATLPLSVAAEGGAVAELLYFIEDNGRNALVYTTARSEYAGYALQIPAHGSALAKRDRFLYVYPPEHEWSTATAGAYETLELPKGDFATLRKVNLNDGLSLTVDANGVYTFRTPGASSSTPDGHKGIWNSPDGFERIAYTWVFPEVFEPIAYEANKPGEWVRRFNTVTYYGEDVNDLIFTIKYRSRLSELYEELKRLFGDQDKIGISEDADGVRLSIETTLLYPSGVADLSPKGREILSRVSGTLRRHPAVQVVVEGHTDTDPIHGQLAQRFPTNWELSAARSVNVIRYLIGQGVAEPRFQARAFSYTHPVAPNDTEAGKAKNRRIELLLARPAEQASPAG
jgi:flagellar motor protein MotB